MGKGVKTMPKPWGQPMLSLRLPAEDIKGLKYLAKETDQTVTDIVRNLIEEHLQDWGAYPPPEQLDGQVRMDV